MVENKEQKCILKIKSQFITKEIFSYIYDKRKLDLIIYNKQFQKILGFDIENYKKISGKYKIVEKNGVGREFKLDNNLKIDYLLFEGEYKEGKRNGKGKEYGYNGKISFEGEYSNGEKLKGKEYYENGKLKFEGKYINGKKWKEKSYKKKSKLEGEYKNEKKFGI